jgi:hypothetical protein
MERFMELSNSHLDILRRGTKTDTDLRREVETRIGQRMQDRDTLIGSSPREVRRHGVELKPRVTGASSRTATFADGSELEVDAVMWATGYRSDYSWIDAPIVDSSGRRAGRGARASASSHLARARPLPCSPRDTRKVEGRTTSRTEEHSLSCEIRQARVRRESEC